ncbi:PQQ-binding-like beta-propeller repeat protein [Gordonia sp. KTR9]|uniref:PQQ-binding-like beta-propeller repeat protein n=1 Tax=Gordonia sp. KTR9 TaxID=337191 RepID=UPI0003134EC0|nr:PQQ-binding-like beta-propeller repeat protein [Gordonia sp. KTR9]
MADRGRREALVLFAMLATAVLVFGVVTVLNGREETEHPAQVRTLEPLPTQPGVRWKVDAASLFGSEFRDAYVRVTAAGEDAVIVVATPIALGKRRALLALDPDTGQPLWNTPRTGWDSECSISRDGRPACTRQVRDGDAVATRVSFIDPRTGEDDTTATIRAPGWSTIKRAGDGFLVETDGTENIAIPGEISESEAQHLELRWERVTDPPDRQKTITMFDSRGRESWSVKPPVNHGESVVSDAGNLFAVNDRSHGGFTVYRLDTGKAVYSALRRTDDESDPIPDSMVLHPFGFATSSGSLTADSRVEFFDASGARTGELSGWRVARGSLDPVMLVDGDELALSSGAAVGIGSIADQTVRWETDRSRSSLQLLDERYAVAPVDSDFGVGAPQENETWTVLDAQTGDRRGQASIGSRQDLFGFDGTRMLFLGETESDHQPDLSKLSAYDVETGEQVWGLTAPTATAFWQSLGPYLFLVDNSADASPSSIARYSS